MHRSFNYLNCVRNSFKQLDQFHKAIRSNAALTAEVTMECWNELAERHSIVRTVTQKIDDVVGKVLRSGCLLWCLVYSQCITKNDSFTVNAAMHNSTCNSNLTNVYFEGLSLHLGIISPYGMTCWGMYYVLAQCVSPMSHSATLADWAYAPIHGQPWTQSSRCVCVLCYLWFQIKYHMCPHCKQSSWIPERRVFLLPSLYLQNVMTCKITQ